MGDDPALGVVLNHVQDKVILLDETGQITYANDAIERGLGYALDEIIGEDAFSYIHPEDVDEVTRAFEQTIAAEEFVETTTQFRFREHDGTWRWLESRMSNLTDEALDGYVVSSRDISERVVAEREQQETATRLEELTAVTGDVLWMFSGDWSELLFLNPAYEDVYGLSAAELETEATSFLDAIHPDDVPRTERAMERLSEGHSVDIEHRVNPEQGYDVWVWVQAEPIIEDGEVVRITGFSRDVTDRRRREKQLCVMDKLLRHNIRNDMTTILGQAEIIEETVPEAADRVAVIRRTGEELVASAEKQRDIIDMLTGDVTKEAVDLRSLIGDSVATIRQRFPTATVTIDGPDSVPAYALSQLRLGITELLENAVRHSTNEAPVVDIGLTTTEERAVIELRDDAPPIPENEVQVLLGNYEMTDVYHSTGLGLWLVYWLVDMMDGEITVDSGTQGNRIRLVFPGIQR